MRLISVVFLKLVLCDVSHVPKAFSWQCLWLFHVEFVRMATTELLRPPCANLILTRCTLTNSASNSVLVTDKFVVVIKHVLEALTLFELKFYIRATFLSLFLCLEIAFTIFYLDIFRLFLTC